MISNSGLEYEVLSIFSAPSNGIRKNRKSCIVKFKDTGYEAMFRYPEAMRGEVKDRWHPSVCSIGFLDTATKKENPKEYKCWQAMIERCYNPSDKSYANYGGVGTTVDPIWYNFANFVKDIPTLDGYDVELYKLGKLCLDKDAKQMGVLQKVYGPSTCTLLSYADNNAISDPTHDSLRKNYVATSPLGDTIDVRGMREFCRLNNLDTSGVYGVLRGECTHHKGWKFERV